MKLQRKFLVAILIIFAASNLLIFFNRNKGFEYIKFSNIQELYPSDPGMSFLSKWSNYNQRFNVEEINDGLRLLNQTIGIDTISNEETKIIRIAGWLYNSFRRQKGAPDSFTASLRPLQQYHYLSIHKEKQLWCGNFQALFGFFCTAAKLSNRYIEVVPM
ncbi:MAG: hypothetical protein ABUT20_46850, partial [Bacteroidota bacterium]